MNYSIGNTTLESVKEDNGSHEAEIRYKLTIRGVEIEETISRKSLLELKDLIGMATMRGRE